MSSKASLAYLLLLVSCAHGQIITLPPGPFTPGQTIQVTLFNNLTFNLGLPCGDPLWLQQNDGSPAVYPWSSDCAFSFPPGTSATLPFTIPASGPGSSGSYVFRSHYAAVRIDVGAPLPLFSAIHGFTLGGPNTSQYFGMGWEVSNTTATSHTFGAGDQIRIYSPGGVIPVATANIAGLTVPANFTLTGTLPLAGLPPGPYTVEMAWNDPLTGFFTTLRHGIQHDGGMELRLRGGHVIPSGGTLPVELRTWGFPYAPSPTYALCIGVLPGSTPVPGGRLFPLVADPAVLASLADGIGGLLIANVGPTVLLPIPQGFAAFGLGVRHPGPAFSGIVVRTAAFAFEPSTAAFTVSQGEDLFIQ